MIDEESVILDLDAHAQPDSVCVPKTETLSATTALLFTLKALSGEPVALACTIPGFYLG